jgi:hypothetical protein
VISAFDVDLGDQDHIFHCRFKEKNIHGLLIHVKEERILRKGTKEYQVEKSIIITTAPKSEYEFTDWTVIDGDINIKKQVA